MENLSTKKLLVELSSRIQTSSYNQRVELFNCLTELAKKELTEAALREICGSLRLTLSRYLTRKSQQLVIKFIRTLLAHQPSSASYLVKVIELAAVTYGGVNVTKAIAKITATAFNWSSLVLIHLFKVSENKDVGLVKQLIQHQATLLVALTKPCCSKINKFAHKVMSKILKTNDNAMTNYIEVLSTLESSFATVVLWGFLFKFMVDGKHSTSAYRTIVLDSFIKLVVGSKSKVPVNILIQSKPFLRQVTHDDFSKLLMPAMQKALLRNPEIILESVGLILSGVTLDLSQYALEFGKSLATHLSSKDAVCQEEASKAMEYLAKQCSIPESITDLLTYLFGVLNGSEGKLTIVMQRTGVLSGIGSLSCHTVSGSSMQQSMYESIIQPFITILMQEVHEGTVIHILKMLSLFCEKFTIEVPSALVEGLINGIGQKTAGPPVRVAYLECMFSAFKGNSMLQAYKLVPVLQKALERALSHPTQVAIVSEGLVASCLLMKLYSADTVLAEKTLKIQSNTLCDLQKLPFLSEKFLQSAHESVLVYVPLFLEYLMQNHYVSLRSKVTPAIKGMIFCLIHSSHLVRQRAKISTTKIISGLGGSELARALFQEFSNIISNWIDPSETELKEEILLKLNKQARVLSECLLTLCSGQHFDETDVVILAQESLLPAHIPVVRGNTILWPQILQKLKLDPVCYVTENKSSLLNITLFSNKLTPTIANAISTLVAVAPAEYLPVVITHIGKILKDPVLRQVTLEEFNIFQTPEGSLYDFSVIENVKEDSVNNKNIKRESKLYSYKEQMEEIELRKEIEAKKRVKLNSKGPELTKKQLEAQKAQLEKEEDIRNRVKALEFQLNNAVTILNSLISNNSMELVSEVGQLVELILPLVKSPLTAGPACTLYLEISKCVFKKDNLLFGYSLGFIILRILVPMCQLDQNWLMEDLDEAVKRVVPSLSLKILSVAAFAYIFPLLRLILTKLEVEEELMSLCLNLMSSQIVRGMKEQDDSSNMPCKQMLETLVEVIGSYSGRIELLATDGLLNVSKSVADGLGSATMAEFTVLLVALQSPKRSVRKAALKSLLQLSDVLPSVDENFEDGLLILRRICVAKCDPEDDKIKELAEKLWTSTRQTLDPSLCNSLLSDITHPENIIRTAAATAMAVVVQNYPELMHSTLQELLETYRKKLIQPIPIVDMFGRVTIETPPDEWEPRAGIALALNRIAPYLDNDAISETISFFVPEALGDRHPEVHKSMLDAAVSIVDMHWQNSINIFLPVFQEFLDKAPDSSSQDAVRQSVVILMGTVARHLDKGDPKIKPIVGKLIEALSTPSEQVQEAVANCLPPLVPALKEEAPGLVRKLLELLLEAENYGERRGAAYGLAGLIKGLGILSLKQLDIMNMLTEAIQDKKNYRHREGALFALEMLCTMLGRLFEPYIVHILPHLLLCFGDSNQYVREATDNTAKAVMSKLSAHGVKLVLPSLIVALEEDSWRTKAGSVELLGAMAYCAPKQLSSCLPNIVPKLIEVLSDSHVKVQKAGAQALKQIGAVIRNPEIQAIVPQLLEALQDPSKKTSSCLSILLATRFVHFIDAPSLALIMPVVQRAFQDRSPWTRKMAAQIIGNMYSLTDQKDLAPYLTTIFPGLKQSLLDPVPEVRSVSARALGALVKGMGDSSFEDLLPWLMQTLTSESSPVDRSGAAQGLSEVVGSLGVEKLHKLMPDIIATAERTDIAPHVKDGYIMMFIYLPAVFTKEFIPYIGLIIIPILKALADENEFVRETALKAGQRIVNMYAESAIALLLPELEKGLFDDNWRIRCSSIKLLGDLLYKISGVSGKMTTETADEDDNFGTEHSHKAIIVLLGEERRNRVLAGLYMGRSDVALMVRQAALHVWKVVVTNTPRTLREILQTLFSLLLGCLASESYDKRQVAARTLGDLVRKLGERVLPEIIPILERGLKSDRADQRQGVCIGLGEIMISTSKEMVLNFVDSLVPTIRMALTDPLPEVRAAAAKTFDSLHQTVGVKALDDIIPPLLQQLSDPELAEYTLDGLRQVMAIKSKVVLPYLVPQLTTPPVNTKALSLLSTVAGDALTKHLSRILPALLLSLSAAFGSNTENQELEYCQAVVLAVTDDVGVRTIIDYLLEASKQDPLSQRQAAVALLCAFCSHTKASISTYVPQLLRGLVHLFTETDPTLLRLSWDSLYAVIKTLDSTEQQQHVADIRQAVRFAVSDLKGQQLLPGFCLPKGIAPILPVFRDAILNGLPELKEQAAQGLGEVIQLTSAEALKPSVVHITGPLIRILGDRFSWNVKLAILDTLALLLEKVGAMLKPFLPQLQTTFLKALSDSHRLVRLKSATALSHLIVIHTRYDPLFTEVHNSAKNSEDISIKETNLHALRCIITPAGDKMSDSIRKSILQTLTGMIGFADDSCRMVAAGSLGSLVKWLPEEELEIVMSDLLSEDDPNSEWMTRHGKSLALMIALKEVAPRLIQDVWYERITKSLITYMTMDRLPIVLSGTRGTGYFLLHILEQNLSCPPALLTTFAKNMNHHSNEVKQIVALTCNYLGKHVTSQMPLQFIKSVIPLLVNGTKEKNTVVKANSEYALVTLLRMRSGNDETQQVYLSMLESGARDSLQDAIHKVLRKVAAQPEPKEEELDDTLLS